MKHWIIFAAAACTLMPTLPAQQTPQPPAPPQAATGKAPGHRHEHFGMRGPDDAARILPPGPWWKDPDVVKRLELSSDQQKRISDTFQQNRADLIHMHSALEEQEALLAPMLDAYPVDQAKVLAQIGRIADMRASLEKAVAKMLLQVRGILNQQQWTRLQQERPIGFRPPDERRGSEEPHGHDSAPGSKDRTRGSLLPPRLPVAGPGPIHASVELPAPGNEPPGL